MAAQQVALTRLHSVPSLFQLVTVAVTLRNMKNAWRAITSAVSRKLLHLRAAGRQGHGAGAHTYRSSIQGIAARGAGVFHGLGWLLLFRLWACNITMAPCLQRYIKACMACHPRAVHCNSMPCSRWVILQRLRVRCSPANLCLGQELIYESDADVVPPVQDGEDVHQRDQEALSACDTGAVMKLCRQSHLHLVQLLVDLFKVLKV